MPDINPDDFRAYIEEKFRNTNEKIDSLTTSINSLSTQMNGFNARLQTLEQKHNTDMAVQEYKNEIQKKRFAQRRNDIILLTGIMSVVVVVVNLLLRLI